MIQVEKWLADKISDYTDRIPALIFCSEGSIEGVSMGTAPERRKLLPVLIESMKTLWKKVANKSTIVWESVKMELELLVSLITTGTIDRLFLFLIKGQKLDGSAEMLNSALTNNNFKSRWIWALTKLLKELNLLRLKYVLCSFESVSVFSFLKIS